MCVIIFRKCKTCLAYRPIAFLRYRKLVNWYQPRCANRFWLRVSISHLGRDVTMNDMIVTSMSWKQMNMVPLAARTVGFVIRDNACCMSWKSTVYVFLTLNKKPLSFIFVSFFRSNHCKIYYFCQPDVFHHFGQPVCPPAWASKSPKAVPNSSPDSMFPPQQIFGLFVKGMVFFEKTTLGVYPIPSGKKTRNPWGCAKKKSDAHDAILMEEKNQVSVSSDTQRGDLVVKGFLTWWKLRQTVGKSLRDVFSLLFFAMFKNYDFWHMICTCI